MSDEATTMDQAISARERCAGPLQVLVIVPAYNEEASLPKLIAELAEARYDVLVVNDASRDTTPYVARQAGAVVLSLSNNLGIGGAVQTGFMYAVRNGYDAVVQVDGDGQHDPGQILVLLAALQNDTADCVIGSRYHPDKPDLNYKTPLLRRLGMRFSTSILRLATGLNISDTTSGFRALNRRAMEYFSRNYPVDHPEAEALLVLDQAGFRVLEVPITMRARDSGSSLFSLFRAAVYPLRVIIGFVGHIFKGAA